MLRNKQSLPWGASAHTLYVPISYEGDVIGFCKSDYANRVVNTLNEDEKLRKALQLACYDLVARSGGSTASVQDLVQQYITKASRPKRGTPVIAMLLRERQQELDITDEEFAKFCDSYRLSPSELQNIYAGQDLDSEQLNALARIIGMSVDELIAAWKGELG